MKQIRGHVAAENTGSRRALEKCGFRVEHIFRFDGLGDGLTVCALDFDGKMKETKG